MIENKEIGFTKEWVCLCQKKNSIRNRTCSACNSKMPVSVQQQIFKEELVSLTRAAKLEKKADTANWILRGQQKFFKRAGYTTATLSVAATAVLAIGIFTRKDGRILRENLDEIPKQLARNVETTAKTYWDDLKQMADDCLNNRIRFTERVDEEWGNLKNRHENANIVKGVRDNAKKNVEEVAFNDEVQERTEVIIDKWIENIENIKKKGLDVKDKTYGRVKEIVNND